MLHAMSSLSRVYIALGSNLEQPVSQILRAFAELAQLPGVHLIKHSSLYCSAPVGRLDQPDFVNAVAYVETNLTPHDLLQALLQIELRHGRIRESLNAPRTLDLDILLYDDLCYQDEKLILPHPRMAQRAFVLRPLLEIDSDCLIPGSGSVASLLSLCGDQRLERINI